MKLSPQHSAAASETPAESDIDQRTQSDRRQKPTSAWAAFPPAGQRMACRRGGEHERPYFVDRFSSAMFIVIVMLMIASIADAILTMQLIEAGAREINPLMDRLLDNGILPFLLVKYVLTVAGLPLLLIFKNHYLFGTPVRVGYLIPVVLVMYLVLIGYQLVLIHKYVGLHEVIPVAASSTSGPFAYYNPAQLAQGEPAGPRMGQSQVSRWQVGMVVTASRGACRDLTGYVAVPTNWPEQQVSIVEEDISPEAKVSYEMVEGGVKIMNVRIPQLASGREVKALITVRILRGVILPLDDTDIYVLPEPKKLPPEIALYLTPSPKIESRAPKIRDLAKMIGADKKQAWRKVEAIYDWVRENVKYEDGPLKGALAALNDGTGDCEERSALFIALCRAADIPARTIWLPDHCYSEFYLEDRKGQGRWFPCQSAGTREFGEITEFAPILQKGDNFRPPKNSRERQRYMAEFLTGMPTPGGGGPQVTFIREEVAK